MSRLASSAARGASYPIWVILQLLKALRFGARTGIVPALVIAAVAAFVLYRNPSLAASSPTPAEPQFAWQFHRAIADYDPAKLVASISSDASPMMQDPEMARMFLERMRGANVHLSDWTYVASYQRKEGGSYAFYVIFITRPDGTQEVWEVLVLDANGKVVEAN